MSDDEREYAACPDCGGVDLMRAVRRVRLYKKSGKKRSSIEEESIGYVAMCSNERCGCTMNVDVGGVRRREVQRPEPAVPGREPERRTAPPLEVHTTPGLQWSRGPRE